ncbi:MULTISPECIES: hypothetical protein [unclassified Rhizobium]|uniref:hypothetical protein n=1 Tax=unclassified Rhizobium TaxID=2613769 RepID=UPI000AB1880D|nr:MULTISPECIES: hypothetical protein [unclassified Rhizobium]
MDFERTSERIAFTVAKIMVKNIIIENSINPMAVILSAPSTGQRGKRFRTLSRSILVSTVAVA